MSEEIQKLEQEIQLLRERNKRVEADKAWETSWFRIISIAVITYVVASLVMRIIGVKNALLNAFIPTIGYLLSTQSLPLIKKWWIKKFLQQ